MADNIISDVLDIVKESFYLMDVDFNDKNCYLIFNEIFKVYMVLNKQEDFRKDLLKFVEHCVLTIDKNESYDYNLFLNNLYHLKLDNLYINGIYNNVISQISTKVY